ncbi:hypothetical protein, partial [Mesorhizobium sp. M0496]|uniref:hypothetical protein n=1 Tax=Mesorhizobium sp. M0496 TaxID=2956952 RepID=UPI003335C19A
MEIEEAREVRTTCPYCGVGCGVLAKVAAGPAHVDTPPPQQTARLWGVGSGCRLWRDRPRPGKAPANRRR